MTEKPSATPASKGQTYIVFAIAGTSYAVLSHQVQHMEMVEQITPVPNSPAFVEGVVFSRGQVVPVINLRLRFGFDRAPSSSRARLLIVQHGERRVGFLADEAREFVTIADTAVHPPHEAIGNLSGSYLDGVATLGQRIVLMLNIRSVIDSTPLTTV